MKHLKSFKSGNNLYYWKVPPGDKLKIALIKIGAPQRFIDKMANKNIQSDIYVGQWIHINSWAWDLTDTFKATGAVYGGEIEVDDYEIYNYKYNL